MSATVDPPASHGRQFWLIPPLERWPRVVEQATTTPGKVVLLLAYAALLAVNDVHRWVEVAAALVVTTFLPQHRRTVVSVAAVYWLARGDVIPWRAWDAFGARYTTEVETGLRPFAVLVAVALCYGLAELAARHPRSALLKRPVLALLVAYAALLVVTLHAPLPVVVLVMLAGVVVVLGKFLWFQAYVLGDRQSPDREIFPIDFPIQFGHFAPFWGSTFVPFPKGGAMLRRIEAVDANALARVQLRGLKLLAWATLLTWLSAALARVVHGKGVPADWLAWLPSLGLPSLHGAVVATARGQPVHWAAGWFIVVANFAEGLLRLTLLGHRIIASARMAGFDALRSTYRPLSSTSLADWWNRVYYYFKELLADFFFFPTYLAFFKKHPRLRMVTATFMAAGVGNFLYHWLRDLDYIARDGIAGALWSAQVYFVYCMILGAAISVSQLRLKRRQRQGIVPRWTPLGAVSIIGFYCLLGVLDDPDRALTLRDYGAFLHSLVPLG